jgi:hypothetical protein
MPAVKLPVCQSYHVRESSLPSSGSRDSKGLRVGRRGFNYRQGQDAFPFATASGPALGPTQPSIQFELRVISPGIKRPGREVNHSSSSRANVTNSGLYIHSPIRLHGVVFNQLSTGSISSYCLYFACSKDDQSLKPSIAENLPQTLGHSQ